MSPYSAHKTKLLAVTLECTFYGLFTAFFCAALYCITTKRGKMNWLLLLTIVAMFITATAHLVANVVPAFQVLPQNGDGSPVLCFLSETSSDLYELAQSVLQDLQILSCDSFLIYRCYVIHGHSWLRILLPLSSLIGAIVCACWNNTGLARTVLTGGLSQPTAKSWVTTKLVLLLVTNALCTGLVAYKMYSVQRCLRGVSRVTHGGRGMTCSTLSIIIESSALCSAFLASALFVYLFAPAASPEMSAIHYRRTVDGDQPSIA